jgi:hypothetical protein
MVCFECSSGNYRITITIKVTSSFTPSSNSQNWVYELRDGVLTKISGSNASFSYQYSQPGTVTPVATITNVTVTPLD